MITPEDALDVLAIAKDSEGLFTRPWLDTKFDLLHTLTLNAYAFPEGHERKTFESDQVQEQLFNLKTKDCYRTLCRNRRWTMSGRPSKRWNRETRYKRFGRTPNE